MQSDETRSGRGDPPRHDGAFRTPGWAALFPVSIVAIVAAEQPVERLLGLQSAIAKAVDMAALLGRVRLRPPLNGLLGIRLR